MRVILLLLATAGFVTAAAAQEGSKPETPSITVRGEASSEVVPDTVMAVFGVVTQRPSAADAMATNSKAVADAIAAIKAEGVAAADIATTNASLTPEMSPPDKGAAKIVGYRAENQLQVRFRPAERAGDMLGKLIDKGVNDVESVTAVVSKDDLLRDRLRADAAQNAQRRAAIYAEALGLKLGAVTRIDPEPVILNPRIMAAQRFNAAPAPVPVEMGRQAVSESVRITFTLESR